MTAGKWTVKIPIYGHRLFFVALKDSETVIEYRQQMVDEFGADERLADQPAFCSYNGGYFGVFISMEDFTHGLLAHEIFHSVCRMMNRIGHTSEQQEPHAYLVEWVTDWIYSCLNGENP